MCSPPLCGQFAGRRLFQGDRAFFGNITLQRLEPAQQFGIGPPKRFRGILSSAARYSALFQSCLLDTESDLGIAIGGFQAYVAEPCTNDVYFNSSFE